MKALWERQSNLVFCLFLQKQVRVHTYIVRIRLGILNSKEIVIDEMIGFMIAMTWMPQTWQAYLAGFCLFRFLDILKPPPIRYFDRRVPGGLGVVLDDVVAGLVANIFLQFIYSQTPWLGIQNIVFS